MVVKSMKKSDLGVSCAFIVFVLAVILLIGVQQTIPMTYLWQYPSETIDVVEWSTYKIINVIYGVSAIVMIGLGLLILVVSRE